MMKIERITRTPDNDPWYIRSEVDVAWFSIISMMPQHVRTFVPVPTPFANAGALVEVPF